MSLSQASESRYLERFRKWKNYLSRGRVSQPIDKEIGRLVLLKAHTPRPVFQRNQAASLNSTMTITHPIYVSCLDGLRNDIFHPSNTNKLV